MQRVTTAALRAQNERRKVELILEQRLQVESAVQIAMLAQQKAQLAQQRLLQAAEAAAAKAATSARVPAGQPRSTTSEPAQSGALGKV